MSEENLVQNGEGEREAGESSRALVGKIARLPKAIREMLNRRLDDGEKTSSLAAWLNELPPVQTVLAAHFGGAAINHRNISNWRANGFKRWQERQEILAEVRELAEEAADINEANPDGLMRMTATLACTKLLRALRDDKAGADVTKAAFAIAALNNVELTHVRVQHEEQRLQQKDALVDLSWDKHLRNCAEIGLRLMDDWQAKVVHEAEIDNSDKIELLGRRMFGDLWKRRRLPWEDENFNVDEEELERMEAERHADTASSEASNGINWTDGTDEPDEPGSGTADSPSLPVNPYAGKTTQQLIAEAESLSRNCRNATGEMPMPPAEPEQEPAVPKQVLSDYDKALREGKTHEEAMYVQFTPAPKPKEEKRRALCPNRPIRWIRFASRCITRRV